ncbi:unnamed protein product [Arabidopsis thaliana]|uniref:(thale cress) hypothetical protein n=1 Tax=Arabidopsis thaliana TaxID=3702 RepID=A0A7G2EBT6_ARATH|nr:unnamed protein product [Arabidopsis thaliana]
MVCVADRSFVVSDSPDNVSSPYYLRLPRPSLDDLIISYKIWSNLCPRSTAYVQIPKLAEFYPENCFTRNVCCSNAFSRTSQSPFHTLVGDLQQHQTQGIGKAQMNCSMVSLSSVKPAAYQYEISLHLSTFCRISQASLDDSPLNVSLAIADSALLLYFRLLLLSVCPFITILFLPCRFYSFHPFSTAYHASS